jgi:glycosyltransferase involved in cell wall biosynthesis
MAILRYFEAAFKRRSDISLVTAGPYTGRKIPWNGGMLLEEKYGTRPDIVVPGNLNTRCPIRWVENRLPWEPDLWVQIDADWALRGRPLKGLDFIVGTDPHVLAYDESRRDADIFFCMQKVYAKFGDVYLPYAYDSVWHASLEQESSPKWDVALLGLHYELRDLFVKGLRGCGVTVKYDLGPVFEEAREIYKQSRVGINWSSLEDVNARVFEIMGMGLPLVTNRLPDMSIYFEEDKHYLGFDDVEDAVRAVRFFLTHPEFADQIARAGQEAVKPHTYDARVEQILKEAKNCGMRI